MTLDEIVARHPRMFATTQWPECPDGWLPLLAQFCDHLETEFPRVTLFQVKPKLGELRLYLHDQDPPAHGLARSYQKRSESMCEQCGEPSARFTRGHWIYNRCPAHSKISGELNVTSL